MHGSDACARRTPGNLLCGQPADARLLDGTAQAVIPKGHAVLIIDMPAAKEMHLFAAIMCLSVIVETNLFLSANGSGEIAVGIEGNAGLFRELFQPREEPRITVAGEDHIRVVLIQESI